MKKRGLILSLISMIMLVSCSAQDKTVILSDDTSKDEELRYSVTSKTIKTDKGEYFIPGYYYEDKIYGALGKELVYLDNYDGSIAYYYTKSEKFNKLDRLDDTQLNSYKVPFNKKYVTYTENEQGIYSDVSVVDYITKEESKIDIFKSEPDDYYNSRSEYIDFVSESNKYVYCKVNSINDTRGDTRSELTIYDIEKKQNYYMKSIKGDNGYVDIMFVTYSEDLDKLYGFTTDGEVCELQMQLGAIVPKVIYKQNLNENETIHYGNSYTESIITGENILLTTNRAESDIRRYDELRFLNLRTLKEVNLNDEFNIDGNIKDKRTSMIAFTLKSGYSIIELSSDSNEYAIIKSVGDDVDLVKKIIIENGFYIMDAICSDDGKKILISVVSENYNDKKQELIEFNIEKLY
ncbi:MAG: hypothetical protein RR620_07985 [Clostridium sp.]